VLNASMSDVADQHLAQLFSTLEDAAENGNGNAVALAIELAGRLQRPAPSWAIARFSECMASYHSGQTSDLARALGLRLTAVHRAGLEEQHTAAGVLHATKLQAVAEIFGRAVASGKSERAAAEATCARLDALGIVRPNGRPFSAKTVLRWIEAERRANPLPRLRLPHLPGRF
jgi:hypothetical protein